MEVVCAGIDFIPEPDRRPMIYEAPPVWLMAVADVRVEARAGIEKQLDEFYGDILAFERDEASEFPVYRAGNFRLHFEIVEPPVVRDDLRPIGVVVPSLAAAEEKLIQRELEYTRQRGLLAGQEALVLLDPAGNWVQISESREVS